MIEKVTAQATRVKQKSIYCRDRIVDTSLMCRDGIVDKSVYCRDRIVTTSLYCKGQVVDAFFATLASIPVDFRNGEFVINGRSYGSYFVPDVDTGTCGSGDVSECGSVDTGECSSVGAAGAGADDDKGARKKIYILLTKHKNLTAILLRFFTWNQYTHSSSALERDGTHYSFNPVRGFTIERPIHKKRGETPCRLYCIEVPERTHAEIEARIKWFVDNPEEYKFNYVGLVFSILRIPIGIGNRYFCSQFVSDLLTATDAATLRKRPSRCFPRHLQREDGFELSFHGTADSFTKDDGIL
jgi:hypothetical protein